MALTDSKQILKVPPRLNSSLSKHNKENNPDPSDIADGLTDATGLSATKRTSDNLVSRSMNLSTTSTSSSKRGGNEQKSMFLRTEERAHRRQQYDDYLKEKERRADALRKNMEMQKKFQEKTEIKIMRENLQFKSRPIKLGKPMIIKPSERPLTEAISPPIRKTSSSSIIQNQARPVSSVHSLNLTDTQEN
jgi:hypothetical protein